MQQILIIDNQKVVITRKKMKNVRLTVKSESLVCVSAPKFVSLSQIEKFVSSKLEWITLQKQKFLQNKETNAFITGKTISVLGKPFTLQILQGKRNAVKFENNLINIFVKNNQILPKTVFLAWAKKHLKKIKNNS